MATPGVALVMAMALLPFSTMTGDSTFSKVLTATSDTTPDFATIAFTVAASVSVNGIRAL